MHRTRAEARIVLQRGKECIESFLTSVAALEAQVYRCLPHARSVQRHPVDQPGCSDRLAQSHAWGAACLPSGLQAARAGRVHQCKYLCLLIFESRCLQVGLCKPWSYGRVPEHCCWRNRCPDWWLLLFWSILQATSMLNAAPFLGLVQRQITVPQLLQRMSLKG